MYTFILSIILGSIAGLFGGALGQSGAPIMLPGLLILGLVPNFKTAVGTVLLTILPPISFFAVVDYYKRGHVNVYISLCLMVSYAITVYVGAHLTKHVQDNTMEYIAGFYFLIISIFFFWNAYTKTFGKSK